MTRPADIDRLVRDLRGPIIAACGITDEDWDEPLANLDALAAEVVALRAELAEAIETLSVRQALEGELALARLKMSWLANEVGAAEAVAVRAELADKNDDLAMMEQDLRGANARLAEERAAREAAERERDEAQDALQVLAADHYFARAEAAETDNRRLRDALERIDAALETNSEAGSPEYIRAALAVPDKSAAPVVSATPTKSGAVPEGNDGAPGAAENPAAATEDTPA